MSAINPASFATPATVLQAPSGLGPGAFLPESSPGPGPEGRQYRTTPISTAVNVSPAGFTGAGRVWDPARANSNFAPMPLANTYPQAFQAADFGVRQMDQYPVEYSQDSQPTLGLQPRYNPAVYDLSNLQNPLYTPALENRGEATRNPNAVGADWSHAFQGLSLGS